MSPTAAAQTLAEIVDHLLAHEAEDDLDAFLDAEEGDGLDHLVQALDQVQDLGSENVLLSDIPEPTGMNATSQCRRRRPAW